MLWLILASVLLVILIMEGRIWRAVAKLIYRTGRSLYGPAENKDGH